MVGIKQEEVIRAHDTENSRLVDLKALRFTKSESRKEAVRTLRDSFRGLLRDPVVEHLRALCEVAGTLIPCTSSKFIDGGGIPGSDAYPATEQAVVLTGAGFRIGTREAAVDTMARSAYSERIPPLNRLVFFPLRAILASGTTPESVKTHLYKVADDIAEGKPIWAAAMNDVKTARI